MLYGNYTKEYIKMQYNSDFKYDLSVGQIKEKELADKAGLISFTLGKNTLRLENAAVCGLAVARESFIL